MIGEITGGSLTYEGVKFYPFTLIEWGEIEGVFKGERLEAAIKCGSDILIEKALSFNIFEFLTTTKKSSIPICVINKILHISARAKTFEEIEKVNQVIGVSMQDSLVLLNTIITYSMPKQEVIKSSSKSRAEKKLR